MQPSTVWLRTGGFTVGELEDPRTTTGRTRRHRIGSVRSRAVRTSTGAGEHARLSAWMRRVPPLIFIYFFVHSYGLFLPLEYVIRPITIRRRRFRTEMASAASSGVRVDGITALDRSEPAWWCRARSDRARAVFAWVRATFSCPRGPAQQRAALGATGSVRYDQGRFGHLREQESTRV